MVVGSMEEMRMRANPGMRFQSLDQVEQASGTIRESPDIHPGQDQFPMASFHQLFSFSNRVVGQPASFTSPGKRDQAKGTHEIAAVLDLQIGSRRRVFPHPILNEIFSAH